MKQPKDNCYHCKFSQRCGGCSFCEALMCKHTCSSCDVVCFKKPGIDKYLSFFNNFEIQLAQNYYNKLPLNIPIIPFKLNRPIDMKFAAVHGATVLSRNGEKLNKRYLDKGFNDVLNIPEKTKGILEFYIKDRQLEGFWDKRKTIYQDIKKLNFEFVISPNYSVYNDSPRIEHLFNMKRSSIIYNELLENGINSIPDISWFNKKDLDTWISEINKMQLQLVAYSFQNVGTGLKASNDWKTNLLGLKYLCENLDSSLDIVIAGVVSPFRIIDIYKSISKSHRLIVLNQSAFIQSRKGILSESKDKSTELSFDDILAHNIDYYNRIYKEIYNSDDISAIPTLSKADLISIYNKSRTATAGTYNELLTKFILRCLKKRRINL